MTLSSNNSLNPLPARYAGAAALGAAIGYWFAFSASASAASVLIALPCLFLLGRLRTSRQLFYGGLLIGLAVYVPHLGFFRNVFGAPGMLLWLVMAMPIGIFLLLLGQARRWLGADAALCMTPVLWTGIEYFRSELYYLRFAWLLPGQVAAFLPGVRLAVMGVYGIGFVYAVAAAMLICHRPVLRWMGAFATVVLAVLIYLPGRPTVVNDGPLRVAGVQLEFPEESKVTAALDRLAISYPTAQILVLSELTFQGPVPSSVRDVVRKYHSYLIAGGMQTLESGKTYNTAYVIGPDGEDLFSQAKSVPVQFMNDSLPATGRRVWESPWGKIGIAICYDLSYGRVMDDFVRQGAQGLIIPTMDVEHWGEYERRMLHGRMAPIRSAEYGIPTFGVWSSGVSQLTDRSGRVIATAGYPGQGEMISGPFNLREPGHIPPDRVLGAAATTGTGVFIIFLWVSQVTRKKTSVG